MGKLKVAFNPVGLWDKQLFRDVIKSLVDDKETFEVYIVSTSTDQAFINNVALQANVDIANVYRVPNDDTLVTKLDQLLIRMFLSGDNPQVRLVDTHSDMAVGILIDDIVDLNKRQLKYITRIQFWTKTILKEINGQETSC